MDNRISNKDAPSYARDYLFDKKSYERLSELINKGVKLERLISELNGTIKDMKNGLGQKDDTGNKKPSSNPLDTLKELSEGVNDINSLESKRMKLINEHLSIKKQMNELLKNLPEARYDRMLLDKNIRFLLKNSDVTIEEIEKEAGYPKGAFSKWENNIATSELSISFLLVASEKLDVTITELLYGDDEMTSPDEERLIGFMDRLQLFTRKGKLSWKKDPVGSKTPFFSLNAVSYKTSLPDSGDEVYIFSKDADSPKGGSYELYMNVGGKQMQQLCSTEADSRLIQITLRGLFSMAEASSKKLGLSEGASKAMDDFMQDM